MDQGPFQAAGIEDIGAVEAIEHYRFLVRLDDALRPLLDPDQITHTAAALLGRQLRVNRCAYAHVDDEADRFTLTGDYNDGVPSIVGVCACSGFGAEFVRLSRLGVPYVVDDAEHDPRVRAVAETYRATGIRAMVSVPVIKGGRFVAGMALHQTTPRAWLPHEVTLLSMVAYRCWESIERNRVNLALSESEAKFRMIANAVPQIVWSTRADGHHDYFNDKWYELTGAPSGHGHGDDWLALLHPDDIAPLSTSWRHSLDSGAPYEAQFRLRHRDGQYRWMLARALPLRGEEGAISRWMGTSTDIHAQKDAEAELQASNQRKDEFLAMLAHELRNPLAPISTAAQLLRIGGVDEKRVRHASDIIARQVQHMTELVDDLLDVSRVTRGLVTLDRERVEIRTVVSNAVEQVRPLIESRGHELSVRVNALDATSAAVFGDRNRLVQVLANLLNNAAKYTPQGGRITLDAVVQDERVVLTVGDNGIGIESDLLPHVFELFTQAQRTPDRSQGGLGLGLALVRSIVAMHGGQVQAHSAGRGRGSSFAITLPPAPGQDLAAAEPSAAAHEGVRRSLKLMVVDDNVDAAVMLSMLLEADGHQVITASDGAQALAAAPSFGAQVYILDIGLPDLDGYELARRLRAGTSGRNATFIALTGYGQAHDRVLSKTAGFDHHFVKPVEIGELQRVLAAVT